MYYEIKFAFQIAARKRASGDHTPSACSPAAKPPPQDSTLFITRTGLAPSDHRDGAASTPNTSRTARHGFLIVTPRLEFPATVRKQSLGCISNRYKLAVFSSRFSAPTRNRQEPAPRQFLIANLELEFFLNIVKSTKYKFLIANKRSFCLHSSGSRFCAPESLFARRNLSFENRSTILAGRLKTIIGAFRRTLVKVKSLLCYGDSHFQLCKMVTNSPSVRLGEN
jgi:hypothetical protein